MTLEETNQKQIFHDQSSTLEKLLHNKYSTDEVNSAIRQRYCIDQVWWRVKDFTQYSHYYQVGIEFNSVAARDDFASLYPDGTALMVKRTLNGNPREVPTVIVSKENFGSLIKFLLKE